MAIQGSCLCGGVRFEIDRAVGPFEICHCNRCRKVSGAQGMPSVEIRTEDFHFLAGHDLVGVYEAPVLYRPPAYQATFCKNCGSPVPGPDPDGELMEIAAGLFDDDPGIKPDKHIFVEHVPAWDRITDGLPQYTLNEIYTERTGKELPADFQARHHGESAAGED